MTPQELLLLAEKVATGIASEEEILAYYTTLQQQQVEVGWQEDLMGDKLAAGAVIRERIWKQINTPVVAPRIEWKRYAAIAAAVLLLLAGAWWGLGPARQKNAAAIAVKLQLSPDIRPGSNKAVLVLADGSTIALDSAANGTLAQQGNSTVTKQSNGQLAYNTTGAAPGEMLYNTLSTPRGGQYTLTLPDGTHVWLNAASSIRYPAAFTGRERLVEVTGEAYFEVSPQADKPFRVRSGNQLLEVLGTAFNINTYEDETAAATTLLQGSVRITAQPGTTGNNQPGVILEPGQQAVINDKHTLAVVKADVDATVAWKNGLFQFNGTDVQTIMRQLSRWYNIEVKYKGPVTSRRFTGKIQRDAALSEVLDMLSYAGVSFTAKDKTIEVIN